MEELLWNKNIYDISIWYFYFYDAIYDIYDNLIYILLNLYYLNMK